MDINKKNRTELKNYFKTNDQPTEEQFAALIDAQLNQAEDGIVKVPGAPLAIKPDSEFGTQEVLNLYSDFTRENPNWSLSLNPRVDTNDPNSNQPGLSIQDATGKSRLFIQSSEAKIGIGTIQPSAPLTVKGKPEGGKPDANMQIADSSLVFGGENNNENEDSAKVAVDLDSLKIYGKTTGGNVSSRKLDVFAEGGMTIKGALNIDGEIAAENLDVDTQLGNETPSDEKIPTQKAVKNYVDRCIPKGLISMWSGSVNEIPEGWGLCDGTKNTPDLSGRFVVGYSKKQEEEDYNAIGNKGGLPTVQLTEDELPAHTHVDQGHDHGINDPGHNHISGEYDRLVRHTGNDTAKGLDSNDPTGSEIDLKRSAIIAANTTGITIQSASANLSISGGDQSHENRPPFYVLAYIIKL